MNIIFGEDQVGDLREKYTVLELDTIRIGHGGVTDKAYCLIETVPLNEMLTLERFKKLHYELMENYRKQNWSFCTQALEHLMGAWGGEVDSFYVDLQNRINQYQEAPPGKDWDATVLR